MEACAENQFNNCATTPDLCRVLHGIRPVTRLPHKAVTDRCGFIPPPPRRGLLVTPSRSINCWSLLARRLSGPSIHVCLLMTWSRCFSADWLSVLMDYYWLPQLDITTSDHPIKPMAQLRSCSRRAPTVATCFVLSTRLGSIWLCLGAVEYIGLYSRALLLFFHRFPYLFIFPFPPYLFSSPIARVAASPTTVIAVPKLSHFSHNFLHLLLTF